MKVCYIAPKCATTKHNNVKVYSSILYMLIPTLTVEAVAYLILVGTLAATYYAMDLKDKHKAKQIATEEVIIKNYNRTKKLQEIQSEKEGYKPVKNVNPKNLL